MEVSFGKSESVSLRFTGTFFQMAGWNLVWMVSSSLIIPAAWGSAALVRWIVKNISFSDGTQASFEGKGKSVWIYFVILMLIHYLSQIRKSSEDPGILLLLSIISLLAIIFATPAVLIPIIRWVFSQIRFSDGARLSFTGTYGRLLGWNVLLILSIFTLIGWAWCLAGIVRWVFRNLRSESLRLHFSGSGWGFLWRGMVSFLILFGLAVGSLAVFGLEDFTSNPFPMALFVMIVLVFFVPFMERWFLGWMISRIGIQKRALVLEPSESEVAVAERPVLAAEEAGLPSKNGEKTAKTEWIALILSFIVPGLGQIYNGERMKGILFYLLASAALIAFAVIPLTRLITPLNVILPIALLIFIYVFIWIEAFSKAKLLKTDVRTRPIKQWYFYLGIMAISLLLIQPYLLKVVRNISQAFKVPSSSMSPTILNGDRILVNRAIYKFGVPYTPYILGSIRTPNRFDVIVFTYPLDSKKDFIQRVVGLPGEVVQIVNKQVYINNRPLQDLYAFYSDTKVFSPGIQPLDNYGPFLVPPNKYFVMGDNRDESFDSRYWGVVDLSQVKGKVRAIYWSWDREVARIRWERIGRLIW